MNKQLLSNFSKTSLFIYNGIACTTKLGLVIRKKKPPKTCLYLFFYFL